jgi:hypothetical protein
VRRLAVAFTFFATEWRRHQVVAWLEVGWRGMGRRHLCRDIKRRQKWRTMSPLAGLGDVGRLLTRGFRPLATTCRPVGAESSSPLSRCDFRRQASVGCKSLAGRDLLRRSEPCRPCEATVRATGLATVVRWKRAHRQPVSFRATVWCIELSAQR